MHVVASSLVPASISVYCTGGKCYSCTCALGHSGIYLYVYVCGKYSSGGKYSSEWQVQEQGQFAVSCEERLVVDLDAAEAQAPDAPGEASRDKKPGRRRAAPLRPSPPLPPSPLPPIPSPLPPS